MDLSLAFHPYDIRGEYPKVVDEDLVCLVSQAVVDIFRPKKLGVSWDSRPSSPKLAAQVPAAVSFGPLPTPVFYHAVIKNGCDFSIMVTASHIQEDWNGLKFVKANAIPLDQGEILKIKDYCLSRHSGLSRNFSFHPVSINPLPVYEQEIISRFQNLKFRSKIAVDTGPTLLTPITQEVFTKLNLNFKLINSRRNLNPLLEESRRNLSAAVIKEKAVLGIIFDGDGDRVIFVDDTGCLIPPAFILGLLAKSEKKAIFDIRAGRAAQTTTYQITSAWAQEFKFAMLEDKTITFGGEASGHFVFRDWYSLDDGLYAALKVLSHINFKEELAQISSRFQELPEKNYAITFKPALVLETIANYYREKGNKVSLVDGVTVDGDNFHLNIRPSLTEPFLRLNAETKDGDLSEIVNQVERLINYAAYSQTN